MGFIREIGFKDFGIGALEDQIFSQEVWKRGKWILLPHQLLVQDRLHHPLHEVLWMVLRLHHFARPSAQCRRKRYHPD